MEITRWRNQHCAPGFQGGKYDRSQQFFELLYRQSCVPDDPAHGLGIDGIGAGNDNDSLTIGHRDMLSLSHHPESGLLKGLHRTAMRDTWELGQTWPTTSTTREGLPFSNSSTVAR